jgi:hypothetical protein
MNLLLLLTLAVPLSCLAFLSVLALLGIMTLGAVVHVLGAVRARRPQRSGVERATALPGRYLSRSPHRRARAARSADRDGASWQS